MIETSRTEGAVRIDNHAIENLPNNGRNFLDYTKLTPGVTIVQGPDGDELSINGQKGIANNISVDGADFNNPFFGEQRGGQRPPFTFNLEAVQEVVVVADGAPAEFGRSSGGFVNVVTKSGTNEIKGSGHVFYIDDSLSSTPKNPDGSSAEEGDFDRAQGGFTLGGPLVEDKVFYFIAADAQRATRTKQTNPNRMDPRLVSFLASIGLPDENGPIERTDDAEVALAKIDWQASANHLVTFRYSYTNSEQVNGTFDVDQWGRSANGIEQDYSHAGTATVHLHAVEQPAQRGARRSTPRSGGRGPTRGRTSRARTGPSRTPPSSSTTTSLPTAPAGGCRSSSPSSTTTTASS